MTSSTPDLDVLIVGGGIGGLSAALSIARAGRHVHVAEQAPEFGEIGAGLQLGPNAMRAFDRLGVYQEVCRTAVLPDRAVVRSAVDGSLLTTLEFGQAFEERYGYPYVVAHRRDVLDALLDACRADPRIVLENNRIAIEARDGADVAEVDFSGGTTHRARLLVGADGIRSRIRRLFDESDPIFSGHIACRGAVEVENVPGTIASDEVRLWIGPGVHLMQYPVRSGTLYNQVAVYERSRCDPVPENPSAELEAAFASTVVEVRDAVARIDATRGWPVYDRDPLPSWTMRRTVIIGDAAHAMLQYLGQGACQALEDAVELGSSLRTEPSDLSVSLKTFEAARLPVASRCQTVARPWGAVWHSMDPMVLALRDRVFRLRSPDDYSELDWLYGSRDRLASSADDASADATSEGRMAMPASTEGPL